MDILDLDSFRSRYSDITVTAVPAHKSKKLNSPKDNPDGLGQRSAGLPPHVEIIPIGPANGGPSTSSSTANSSSSSQQLRNNKQQQQQQQQQQKVSLDAVAYANEYKQVLAKLEYTKYVQTQLQLMSISNGTTVAAAAAAPTTTTDTNKTVNIEDAYGNLLKVIAEMHSNLGPTAIGLRAPKERLLRDIAHARVLVRECSLLLMRD